MDPETVGIDSRRLDILCRRVALEVDVDFPLPKLRWHPAGDWPDNPVVVASRPLFR